MADKELQELLSGIGSDGSIIEEPSSQPSDAAPNDDLSGVLEGIAPDGSIVGIQNEQPLNMDTLSGLIGKQATPVRTEPRSFVREAGSAISDFAQGSKEFIGDKLGETLAGQMVGDVLPTQEQAIDFAQRAGLDIGITLAATSLLGPVGAAASGTSKALGLITLAKGAGNVTGITKFVKGVSELRGLGSVLGFLGSEGVSETAKQGLVNGIGSGGSALLMGDDELEVERQAIFGAGIGAGLTGLFSVAPIIRKQAVGLLENFKGRKEILKEANSQMTKAFSPTLRQTNSFKKTVEPEIQKSFLLENNIYEGARNIDDVAANARNLIGGQDPDTGNIISGSLGQKIRATVTELDETIPPVQYTDLNELADVEQLFGANIEAVSNLKASGKANRIVNESVTSLPANLLDEGAEASAALTKEFSSTSAKQLIENPTNAQALLKDEIAAQLLDWKKTQAARQVGIKGANLSTALDKTVADLTTELGRTQKRIAAAKRAENAGKNVDSGLVDASGKPIKTSKQSGSSSALAELEAQERVLNSRLELIDEAVANPTISFDDAFEQKQKWQRTAFEQTEGGVKLNEGSLVKRKAAEILQGALRKNLEAIARTSPELGERYVKLNAEFSVISSIKELIEKARNQQLVEKTGAFNFAETVINRGGRLVKGRTGIERTPKSKLVDNALRHANSLQAQNEIIRLRSLTNAVTAGFTKGSDAVTKAYFSESVLENPEIQQGLKARLVGNLLVRSGQVTKDELTSGSKTLADIDPQLLEQATGFANQRGQELLQAIKLNGVDSLEARIVQTQLVREFSDSFPGPKSGIPGELPTKDGRLLAVPELRMRYSVKLKDELKQGKISKSQAALMRSAVQGTGRIIDKPSVKTTARIAPQSEAVEEADL